MKEPRLRALGLPTGWLSTDFWRLPIVRAGINLCIATSLAVVLSTAVGGCDKLKRNDPAPRARAEMKRQQAACGSAAAGDRLKNSIFDEAIAERQGDRANLDVLADYSVARLQDPVVKGWDRSLDITRCKGRFILEVPPGAERAFAGEHQLQAEIDYTAQASADGAGFVYQEKGAEPIVARLAAFNMATGAYRPPPAIDEPQATTEMEAQPTLAQAKASLQTRASPSQPSRPVRQPRAPQITPAKPVPRARVAEGTRTEPTLPMSGRSGNGEATVRAFYGALGSGNGAAASSQVIPEKRSSGAYSPGAMSRFYGRLAEPIRLTGIVPLAGGAYRVKYRYSAGRSRCNGTAVVRLTNRSGRDFIHSIQALNGC